MKNLNSGCQKLWAPWRMKYIEESDPKVISGCIFCDKPADNAFYLNRYRMISNLGCFEKPRRLGYASSLQIFDAFGHTFAVG